MVRFGKIKIIKMLNKRTKRLVRLTTDLCSKQREKGSNCKYPEKTRE